MLSIAIYVSVAFVTVCYFSDWLFSLWDDPTEPPRVKAVIPLIGHLLGLIKSGSSYFTQISAQQESEMYILPIFNFKIYIINSRRLVPLVQRNSKSLSFSPFQQVAAQKLVDASHHTVDLHGDPAFMRTLDKATRSSLAPGPQLDCQNLRAINTLKDKVEELLSSCSTKQSIQVPFYKWCRHVTTIAATNGIYGTSNPYLDKNVEEAFWTWNDYLPSLLAGLNIFASKGVKARQYLFGRFQEYLKGNYSDAAEVTKERVKVMSEYGILADDTARMTLSFGIALLSNTAPTAFWTLYNIYSQPALLQELRSELEENAVTKSKPTTAADADFEVDVAAIKTKCPLLLSIFEETQRTLTIHANIRKVLEDTVLDKYCLKKGNYVQIPNAPIHRNTELWGADANNFNSHRFVKSDSVELASSLPPHAFLAWGTAPHLCPARQFASTEILVMAALLALKVEVEPVGHNWVKPETAAGELVVILPPKKDFDVKMKPRQGWEGKWSIKIGESKTQVKLASG